MIDNIVLDSLREFCWEYVSPRIKLMVPNDNDIRDYQLQHPNVFVGWMPPPNQLEDVPQQLPDGVKKAVPAMVIGLDEGDDDGTDAGIGIRITFVVYNPGLYAPEGEAVRFTPNYQGYRDLLNLIFICRQELTSRVIAGHKTSVQRPLRWGMYQQQPAGYWVGWLTFRATIAPLPYINRPDYLSY